MADSRKPVVVDGLTVVRMVRHAKGADAPPPPPAPAQEAPRPPEPGRPHIGHTVRPPRHDLRCYECGYAFTLTARSERTYCPKCRTILEWKDYLIQGEWRESAKTAGVIRLGPQGVLKEGKLIGTDVIVEGRVEEGEIEAFRWLEIGAGAAYNPVRMRGTCLRVAAGAVVRLEEAADFAEIEVYGRLEGQVRARRRVHIRCGGEVRGKLEAPDLAVEEGGGLVAEVRVMP